MLSLRFFFHSFSVCRVFPFHWELLGQRWIPIASLNFLEDRSWILNKTYISKFKTNYTSVCLLSQASPLCWWKDNGTLCNCLQGPGYHKELLTSFLCACISPAAPQLRHRRLVAHKCLSVPACQRASPLIGAFLWVQKYTSSASTGCFKSPIPLILFDIYQKKKKKKQG